MGQVSESPPTGEYKSKGRSAVVDQLIRLPRGLLGPLGLNDYIISAIDNLVTLCAIVIEEEDAPLLERLGDAVHEFGGSGEDLIWIGETLETVSDEQITQWAERVKQADYQKFLNRLLGSGTYTAVVESLKSDARVVLAALQIGVRAIQPWSVALDDVVKVLNKSQIQESGLQGALATATFRLVANMEAVLGVVLKDPDRLTFLDGPKEASLSESEIEGALVQFRELVSARANENLSALSNVLARKVQGARDALEYSVDGVSQAANSLVELIDRIAREAFSEHEVLQWLEANQLSAQHTYERDGNTRPTKQGQIFCLVWAGMPPKHDDDGVDFRSVVAYALLNMRNQLQRLKHADDATDEERQELGKYLNAVGGAVMLLVRMCWGGLEDERVSKLRAQFSS